MGTEILGVQLHESQATEEALRAESDGTVQGASSETHKPDAGISLVGMVHDLAEYLREWIGYFGRCETPGSARQAGEMAPTPTSVDGLEAVETGNHEISGAPQARHRCAGRRENGGLAPMDRGTLRTRQR